MDFWIAIIAAGSALTGTIVQWLLAHFSQRRQNLYELKKLQVENLNQRLGLFAERKLSTAESAIPYWATLAGHYDRQMIVSSRYHDKLTDIEFSELAELGSQVASMNLSEGSEMSIKDMLGKVSLYFRLNEGDLPTLQAKWIENNQRTSRISELFHQLLFARQNYDIEDAPSANEVKIASIQYRRDIILLHQERTVILKGLKAEAERMVIEIRNAVNNEFASLDGKMLLGSGKSVTQSAASQ